jgi:malate synthase
VAVTADQLLDVAGTAGRVTDNGLRSNVSVALQYLAAWLGGNGAVAIFNLMEDAATAEIARSQIWQWIHNDVVLDSGERVTPELVRRILDEETVKLDVEAFDEKLLASAREIFEQVALDDDYAEFLTVPAAALID